jgi:hypothetical protein
MASDYQRLQNDAAEINSTGEKEPLPSVCCVSVFRQYHPASLELAAQKAKFHWELSLTYHPGMQTHGWALYPNDGNRTVPSGALIGEGTPAQIADHVCIAVKRRGANIH